MITTISVDASAVSSLDVGSNFVVVGPAGAGTYLAIGWASERSGPALLSSTPFSNCAEAMAVAEEWAEAHGLRAIHLVEEREPRCQAVLPPT